MEFSSEHSGTVLLRVCIALHCQQIRAPLEAGAYSMCDRVCDDTQVRWAVMLQLRGPLAMHQLQVPHLELHLQLLTWKGCLPQPRPPDKLPVKGLPLSCGRQQAQLRGAVAWAAPKQAWGCKGHFYNQGWGISLMHQRGTCLVSCPSDHCSCLDWLVRFGYSASVWIGSRPSTCRCNQDVCPFCDDVNFLSSWPAAGQQQYRQPVCCVCPQSMYFLLSLKT